MENFVTPIIFLVLGIIMKVIIDTIQFHWNSSIFRRINRDSKIYNWLNPAISWQNKWKDGYRPHGEKFWGSSRWFVPLTDAWHLFDSFRTIFYISALTFFNNYIPFTSLIFGVTIISRILDTFILFIILSIIFEYLFTLMEKKRFKNNI